MGLAFADKITDCNIAHQHFESRNSAFPRSFWYQGLAYNSFQQLRKLRFYLPLLAWREHVYQSVYSLRGIQGVKRTQYQVTGFGGSYSCRNSFKVPPFSNHNDIWIMTQGMLKRRSERFSISSKFPLCDNTIVVLQKEFNR